jgi:hypothetical protein
MTFCNTSEVNTVCKDLREAILKYIIFTKKQHQDHKENLKIFLEGYGLKQEFYTKHLTILLLTINFKSILTMRSLSEVKNTTRIYFWTFILSFIFIKRVQPCYEELFLTINKPLKKLIRAIRTTATNFFNP